MASTTKDLETQILSSFLLSRASLQDIISLRQFTELFPKDQRSNPQVKLLYRELQLLRNKTCERVKKNIKHEAALGIKQRSELEKKRRALKRVDDETMTAIEVGFHLCLFSQSEGSLSGYRGRGSSYLTTARYSCSVQHLWNRNFRSRNC